VKKKERSSKGGVKKRKEVVQHNDSDGVLNFGKRRQREKKKFPTINQCSTTKGGKRVIFKEEFKGPTETNHRASKVYFELEITSKRGVIFRGKS